MKRNKIREIMKVVIVFVVYVFLFCPVFMSCHEEEEEEKYILSITYAEKNVKMSVGKELSVSVVCGPEDAKNSERVSYSLSQGGIIEIKEGSNDGVVFKGIMPGSVVVIAKSSKVTAYLEVIVEGGDFIAQPYIALTNPVVEIKNGEQKSISVTLYGGSVLDNNGFQWSLIPKADGEEDSISVLATANVVVVKGLKKGNQKIRVGHPRAEYSSELLIFVNESNEFVKYISCDRNVIMLEAGGQYEYVPVTLQGGSSGDKKDFQFTVVEGAGNVNIIPNNEIVNIKALKVGSSVIRVTHPMAAVPFEIRVICVAGRVPIITLDRTFVMLEYGRNVVITAGIENSDDVTAMSQFTFEYDVDAERVVSVSRAGNEFFVQAVGYGLAKIMIRNSHAEYSREVLVYVRPEGIYRDDYFITTSQNVIQTQVGDSDIHLTMILVNGNSADANSFTWDVSDGTVIEVSSGHGRVGYGVIPESRTTVVKDVFTAIAVITPVRSGVSTITVSHPKSEANATVLVKVYPKGTFVGTPVIVKGDGLIRVLKNDDVPVLLTMVSGGEGDTGGLDWSTEDGNVASVMVGMRGLANIVSGNGSGKTKLTVDGGNLKQKHEAIVLVGTTEELGAWKLLYVDQIYQNAAVGQTVRVPVMNSGGERLSASGYGVLIDNKNAVYGVIVKGAGEIDELVIQGKEPGEARIKLTHTSCDEEGITLFVRVEPSGLTIEKPYYITGPEIVGVAVGSQKQIKVNLEGATTVESGKIEWEMESTGVVTMMANGEECYVTGKAADRQTVITARHKKSGNEKKIIVYTALTEADLNSKIVVGLDKLNYLMVRGEELFITLKTNATDTEKSGLIWQLDDISVLFVDDNKDSAQVRALSRGNAKVTIRHESYVDESNPGKLILPVVIYFSVIEAGAAEKQIQGPATIELLIGESRIVSLTSRNLADSEKRDITWNVENSQVAGVQGNGDSAYMMGLSRGVTYVNVAQGALGYSHRSVLLCAATKEELAAMYIMGLSQTYYRMNIGEERVIQLEFGSNGFPEVEKAKIEWKASEGAQVRVTGNGKGDRVTVVAQNEGVGYVDIESQASENRSLRITFEVSGKAAVNRNLRFDGFERIKGIVANQTVTVTIRIFDGENEVTGGYSLLELKDISEERYVGAVLAGNILSVTAKPLTGTETGQSVITVSHGGVLEDARILIYTANTQAQLDSMYPIAAEKKNYLVQVGQSATVKLVTKDDDENSLNRISWGISNAGIITNPVFDNKKTANFKGVKVGSTELLVHYPNTSQVVERIYVSVVENNNIDFSKKIYTENIIGLVKGGGKDTSVITVGFTSDEEADLLWETTNSSMVEIVSQSGKTATIRAKETAAANGECYVTVRYGNWLKRHILVYVCDTLAEVSSYKAMNMENQYARMGKGEILTLPMYYAPNRPQGVTVWNDRYENGVVSFESKESGGKIELTGLNEGVAVLEAINADKTNPYFPLELYVEVSNNYVGIPQSEPRLKYITTGKTVYLLNPQDRERQVELQVSAIGMDAQEISAIQWKEVGNGNYIKVHPNGDKCVIMSNGKEGETELEVWHPSANKIKIKIISDINAQISGVTYIYFEDIVKIGLGQELEFKNVSLVGSSGYNSEYFTVDCDKPSVLEARMAGSTLYLKGLQTGQARLVLDHRDSVFKKEVIVIITASEDGLVYLTTKDNFSVLQRGEYKTISVEMKGFTDSVSKNYRWELDNEHRNIIELNPNGMTAVVVAKDGGIGQTARIKVTHAYTEEYPLYVYVRVSDAGIKPVYITMEQNIISVKEGYSMTVYAELMNGDPSMYGGFTWRNQSSNIAVNSSGNTALITGKSPGVGMVKIGNASTFNELDLIVIVEADNTQSGIYITTDSMLVEMKPTDAVRTVTVRLVGGNPEDVYGFKWEIADENSVEKYADGTSKKVVDMTAGADRSYIRPVNEGEAVIRITHPRTSYRLEIKIDVKQNKKIEFKQRNAAVNAGETLLISVESPTGVRVIYESGNNAVAAVSGTNKMCILEGVSQGTVVITARDASGKLSDEVLVQVNKRTVDDYGVITMGGNFVTLNTIDSLGISVTAGLSGKTNTGEDFKPADSENIRWKIVTPGGDKVIRMTRLSGGDTTLAIGDNITISPYGVSTGGEVEIQLSHDKLRAGYIKRFYVRVEVSDVIFTLDKSMVVVVPGESGYVKCSVMNAEQNYKEDVEWFISDPEVVQEVYRNEKNDEFFFFAKDKDGKPQVAEITAVYRNSTRRVCKVFVNPEPTIKGIPAKITVLKGEPYQFGYVVSPADSEVKINPDDLNMFTISQTYGMTEESGGSPSVRSGANSVTIKANYTGMSALEVQFKVEALNRVVTKQIIVEATDKINFYWEKQTPIRITGKTGHETPLDGRPGFPTVKYMIEESQTGKVDLYPSDMQFINSFVNKMAKVRGVEKPAGSLQEVQILPFDEGGNFKDGYFLLQVVPQYGGGGGITLDKEVYIYYEKIDFDYEVQRKSSGSGNYSDALLGKSGNFHTNIDKNFRSLTIADGEKSSLKYKINEAEYPGHSFRFSNVKFIAVGSTMGLNFSFRLDNEKEIEINVQTAVTGTSSVFGGEALEKGYLGVLEIDYQYFNGGTAMSTFKDRILVFGERWRRY